jgi:hypothetical protein
MGHTREGSTGLSVSRLRRRAPHILGAGAFGSLSDIELDTVTLTQIVDPLAVHRTLVKEILLPFVTLDEPKPLINP